MHTIPLALSEQQVSPGVLGFIVVALLGLALFLLLRNMNKQMRKINFDDGSGDPAPFAHPEPDAKTAKPAAEPAPTDPATEPATERAAQPGSAPAAEEKPHPEG